MADLSLPFLARGKPGRIEVGYSVNGDPSRWGFQVLRLGGDVSRAAAFPVFEASVLYPEEGYLALFGWIQVVRYWSASGEDPAWSLLDNPPQLRGLGVPFYAWGSRPRMFDAPLDTPEGIVRWQALTFLTQTPDGLVSRVVEPVIGVTWGYLIEDAFPTLLPVVQAERGDWLATKNQLESDCPAWTFSPDLPHATN